MSKKCYLFIKKVHYCIGMFDLWNCFEELGENSLFLKWGRGEEKLRVKSLTSKNAYSSSEICIPPKNFTSRRNNSIPQQQTPLVLGYNTGHNFLCTLRNVVCVGTLGLFSKGKIEPSSVVCVWEGGGGEGRGGSY